jgi:hypothetical protein
VKNESRLTDLKVIDKYVYKRTEYLTGKTVQEAYSWKLWILASMRTEIIAKAHDSLGSAHGGIAKNLNKLRNNFYWPKMFVDVSNYIANCDVSKQTKPPNSNQRPPMVPHYYDRIR